MTHFWELWLGGDRLTILRCLGRAAEKLMGVFAVLSRRCAPSMRRATTTAASTLAAPAAHFPVLHGSGGGGLHSERRSIVSFALPAFAASAVVAPVCGVRSLSSVRSKWGVVNDSIKARVVQLVDDDGKITPNVPFNQALAEAKKRGVDLVQVSSNGDQVVCRMFDAKKRLFSMKKAAKPQKPKQDKEIVFGVKIEVRRDDCRHGLGHSYACIMVRCPFTDACSVTNACVRTGS